MTLSEWSRSRLCQPPVVVQGALQLSVIVFAVQLNALLTEPPIEKAETTIAAATAATRMPYSTPAAPLSSRRSLFNNARMTVLPFDVNKRPVQNCRNLAAVKNFGLK
jgi:hypothetical protein